MADAPEAVLPAHFRRGPGAPTIEGNGERGPEAIRVAATVVRVLKVPARVVADVTGVELRHASGARRPSPEREQLRRENSRGLRDEESCPEL